MTFFKSTLLITKLHNLELILFISHWFGRGVVAIAMIETICAIIFPIT